MRDYLNNINMKHKREHLEMQKLNLEIAVIRAEMSIKQAKIEILKINEELCNLIDINDVYSTKQ